MTSFKSFLLLQEALKLSIAKKYAKNWDKTRYSDWFNGKYRIYLPLIMDVNNKEAIIPPKDIEDTIKKAGFEIADYKLGTASKPGSKNIYKIGSILQKNNPTLKPKFDSDPKRRGSKLGADLLVAISRHPYDIAGMSTGRGWTSCMDVEIGSNKRYCSYDISEGTLIAYLIKSTDKNINNPIARVLIKPYINDIGDVLLVRSEEIYGTDKKGFVETVDKWLNEKQKEKKEGHYKISKKLYKDAGDIKRFYILSKEMKEKFKKSIKEFKNNLTMEKIEVKYPWIMEAKIKDAILGEDEDGLIWYDGTWESGIWKWGIWKGGTWENGWWESGRWKGGTWKGGWWESGRWKGGTWKNGTWKGGTWVSGTWVSGTWVSGRWKGGIWKSGTWEDGTWERGKDKSGKEHKDSPDKW